MSNDIIVQSITGYVSYQ